MAKKKVNKIKNPWDQCKKCLPAKCCTYFALEVDEPESRKDYAAFLWQIAHKGVSFYIYRKRWHIMIDTVCNFLTADNKCAIYETRPYICKEHSIETCEYTGEDYGFSEHRFGEFGERKFFIHSGGVNYPTLRFTALRRSSKLAWA